MLASAIPICLNRAGNSLWNGTAGIARSPSIENTRSSTRARSSCALRQTVRLERVYSFIHSGEPISIPVSTVVCDMSGS
jgi:hypothetical protein